MPNLATTLKQEISRLARKELRREVEGLKKATSIYRSEIAALKKTVADLQRALKTVGRQKAAVGKSIQASTTDKASGKTGLRFRASGLATNRKRLGLSAADFGLLVGASGASIYLWEQGKSRPAEKNLAAISALRGIGKREVNARLAALKGPEQPKGKKTVKGAGSGKPATRSARGGKRVKS